MATNEQTVLWYQSQGGFTRMATTLPPNTTIYKGALAVYAPTLLGPTSLVSGTALTALCTTVNGADANGGIIYRAKQHKVRIIVSTLAGMNQVLQTNVVYNDSGSGFTSVEINLGTDGGGAPNDTAATVVQAIRANGEANELLEVNFTGTGAGLLVPTGITNINYLYILGVADETYSNITGSSITQIMKFRSGCMNVGGFAGDAPTAAMIGSEVVLLDDVRTVAATYDALPFKATLMDVDSNGTLFAKIH